jgi:hypothetical protein
MRASTLLTTLTLGASTAHAAKNYLVNHCSFPVWYTQVGGGGYIESTVPLAAGATAERAQFFHESGTSIKILQSPDGLWKAAPTLQFVYSYEAGKNIYYGIATDFGFDFWGKKLVLEGEAGKGAPSIIWNGTVGPVYTAAYLGGELELTFTLCA